MSTPESQLKPSDTGFRGWLIIPLIGVVLTPIFLLFGMIRDFTTWISITNSLDPLQVKIFSFLALNYILLFPLSVFLLYIFLKKRKSTPKVYISFFIIYILLTIGDIVIAHYLESIVTVAAARQLQQSIYSDGGTILTSLIWIAYFLRSKRVQRTFVN